MSNPNGPGTNNPCHLCIALHKSHVPSERYVSRLSAVWPHNNCSALCFVGIRHMFSSSCRRKREFVGVIVMWYPNQNVLIVILLAALRCWVRRWAAPQEQVVIVGDVSGENTVNGDDHDAHHSTFSEVSSTEERVILCRLVFGCHKNMEYR